MREAGVTIVTPRRLLLGAGSSPSRGAYDFAWLDEVMDLLGDAGIEVSLATAPRHRLPGSRACTPRRCRSPRDGVRLSPGSRQHYCPSSPVYRAGGRGPGRPAGQEVRPASRAGPLARRNEYGCHIQECYCDVSAEGLPGLAARALRRPRRARRRLVHHVLEPAGHRLGRRAAARARPRRLRNPAQDLDYRRFSSDAPLDCYRAERAVLQATDPRVPITTNIMGMWEPVADYASWAADFDSWRSTCTPSRRIPARTSTAAFFHDQMRSLGGGRPYLMMETATSAISYRPPNRPKRDGLNRLWSHQAVARGADAVMYFQWRASAGRRGEVPLRDRLARRRGQPDLPRGGRAGRRAGGAVRRRGLAGAADVAIVHDYANWWALELDCQAGSKLKIPERVRAHYAPLWRENVTVDVVPPRRTCPPTSWSSRRTSTCAPTRRPPTCAATWRAVGIC